MIFIADCREGISDTKMKNISKCRKLKEIHFISIPGPTGKEIWNVKGLEKLTLCKNIVYQDNCKDIVAE